MLADVRSLVAPLDLELYDRLVLHREREAHQAWHGGPGVLYPQGYWNQNAGHGHPARVGPLSHITLHQYCGMLTFEHKNHNLLTCLSYIAANQIF